ncbi:MAG: hypothetical protein HYX49_00910 [Chloroflexi bacterium]|nr:hypothetical protein [Chloroflexota bacterium]
MLDVFKHSLSATDGLPPYTQARIIDLISNQLIKARPYPCLWVSVDAPGSWYFNEIKRLIKRRIPITILSVDRAPIDEIDFRPYASPSIMQGLENPSISHPFRIEDHSIKASALRVLRIMARLKTAHTAEITSLAGFSETHVRTLLKELKTNRLIEWKRIGKYDGWEIKNKGLRLVHLSWNIPKGVHFAAYRREFRYAGERHRRVARMWRAWLENAYRGIEIWESWTEVSVRYGIPDALAWGIYHGREMLFWLEVDSGHSSRKVMERNYRRRLYDAYLHAKEWGIQIVFCIMGPPWVVEEFRFCIPHLFPNLAMIGHDWREFGKLPVYEIGRWQEDLEGTQFRRMKRSEGKLSFDPKQYPAKPKEKRIKLPKPKSIKPRFRIESLDDDYDGYQGWAEREE